MRNSGELTERFIWIENSKMDILESITEHETTFEHIGEECGVVGIAASKRENVAALAY